MGEKVYFETVQNGQEFYLLDDDIPYMKVPQFWVGKSWFNAVTDYFGTDEPGIHDYPIYLEPRKIVLIEKR